MSVMIGAIVLAIAYALGLRLLLNNRSDEGSDDLDALQHDGVRKIEQAPFHAPDKSDSLGRHENPVFLE